MTFQFQKALYTHTAMLKAAYHFTDEYYVHLSSDAYNYIVSLTPKSETASAMPLEQFQNEILAQTIKEKVASETKNLRTLLMARALSSSMIGDELPDTDTDEPEENSDSILKDWFAQNE